MQLYPKENDESTWRQLTVGKNALFFGQFFLKSSTIYNITDFFLIAFGPQILGTL